MQYSTKPKQMEIPFKAVHFVIFNSLVINADPLQTVYFFGLLTFEMVESLSDIVLLYVLLV